MEERRTGYRGHKPCATLPPFGQGCAFDIPVKEIDRYPEGIILFDKNQYIPTAIKTPVRVYNQF